MPTQFLSTFHSGNALVTTQLIHHPIPSLMQFLCSYLIVSLMNRLPGVRNMHRGKLRTKVAILECQGFGLLLHKKMQVAVICLICYTSSQLLTNPPTIFRCFRMLEGINSELATLYVKLHNTCDQLFIHTNI